MHLKEFFLDYYAGRESATKEKTLNEIYDIFGKNITKKSFYEKINEFANEYKEIILFAIEKLGDTHCTLIQGLKIDHALQIGLESYWYGGLKNDSVAAGILSDVLQYAENPEDIRKLISEETIRFNGKKVLNIFDKTGQNPIQQVGCFNDRKKYQLNLLKMPGTTSFSASLIVLISRKINLQEIARYFQAKKEEFLNSPVKTSSLNDYMAQLKDEFWKNYDSITQEEAKSYYAEICNIFSRQGNVPDNLLAKYEETYFDVFEEYPE